MKFIHTGDIHWGMCPDANKPWVLICVRCATFCAA